MIQKIIATIIILTATFYTLKFILKTGIKIVLILMTSAALITYIVLAIL